MSKLDYEKGLADMKEAQELLRKRSCRFDRLSQRKVDQKKAISKWMVQYLVDEFTQAEKEPCIFLDTGTTIQIMSECLLSAMFLDKLDSITVVTNSGPTFNQLHPWRSTLNFNLIHTGGEYDTDNKAFWGEPAIKTMKSYDYHVVISGASGISFHEDKGTYSHCLTLNEETTRAIQTKPTDHRIILADHSKIGNVDVKVCVKPSELLVGVQKECLIVTTYPPEKDKEGRERFEKERCAFSNLCRRLNTLPDGVESWYNTKRSPNIGLKLIVVDQEGNEIEEKSISSTSPEFDEPEYKYAATVENPDINQLIGEVTTKD